MAYGTPFSGFVIIHLGVSYETLPDPVVRRSLEAPWRLRRIADGVGMALCTEGTVRLVGTRRKHHNGSVRHRQCAHVIGRRVAFSLP